MEDSSNGSDDQVDKSRASTLQKLLTKKSCNNSEYAGQWFSAENTAKMILEYDVEDPAIYSSVNYRQQMYGNVPIIAQANNAGQERDCGVRSCFMAVQSALNKYCRDKMVPPVRLSFDDLKSRCGLGIPIAKILEVLSKEGIVEERYFVNGRRVGGCPSYRVYDFGWSFPAQYPESEAVVRRSLLTFGPAVVGVFKMRQGFDFAGQVAHSKPLYYLGDESDQEAKPIVDSQPIWDHFGLKPQLFSNLAGQWHCINPDVDVYGNFEAYHAVLIVGSPQSARSGAVKETNPRLYWYKNTWADDWGIYGDGCQQIDLKLLIEAYCISKIVKVTEVGSQLIEEPLKFVA